jgi:hypothetical protein
MITGSSDPLSIAMWWYKKHIGETFEVEEDPEREEYFYTFRDYKGKPMMHHIMKSDCVVLDTEPTEQPSA